MGGGGAGGYVMIHVLMRDEKEVRKKQARSYKQQAKQHSTPKAVTFPKKNELPQVGLEHTTLYTLDRALYCICSKDSVSASDLLPS